MLECTPVEQKMKQALQKVQQVTFYPILSILTPFDLCNKLLQAVTTT